jgi:hypothetical protein
VAKREPTTKQLLARANVVAAQAHALREERQALAEELVALRKNFERARGEAPFVDLTLLQRLEDERRTQTAYRIADRLRDNGKTTS